VAAQEHLAQGIALYAPQPPRALTFLYGHDPRVACFGIAAWVLWLRGYPDQALARSEEALTLARQLSHPLGLAIALFFRATVAQHCHRQEQAGQQWTEEAVTLSTAQGFPLLLAINMVVQGVMLVRQGQGAAGVEQMTQGLGACRATGEETLRTYFLALLAEAYSAEGQPKEGLTVLAEALAIVDTTGERFYEAELWRLKGALTLQKEARGWRLETSPPSSRASSLKPQVSKEVEREAEACFHKAIEIARHQGAKSLELRAVMSVSRLWHQQGKKQQARKLLAEIYGWFTEGFDTADLHEAKALRQALA